MTNQKARPRALITGASAGIGAAFARHLARNGHDLIISARRKDRLDDLAQDLSTKHGASIDVVEADLAADQGVALLEERLQKTDLDMLVNNAGFGTIGEFVELPLERELQELDLNVRALMRLSHAALTRMVERRRGAVINVASTAAFQPIPHNATYSATKAFVLHFSEALHEEVKRHRVTVTCLCPGPVKTEFQEVARLDDSSIPAMMWTNVDTVVESALSAVRTRRAIAVPGTLNAMTAAGSRMVPSFLSPQARRRLLPRPREEPPLTATEPIVFNPLDPAFRIDPYPVSLPVAFEAAD